MQVRDVMLPRSQMIVLERDMSLQEVLPVVVDAAHSRYPVVGDNRDEVVGILLAKDLLPYFQLGSEEKFNLRDILRPPAFIPESKRLNVLLKEFRASRNHIAIVVDEYGGVAGMITIEDVLEQIVGEIEDEHDYEDDIYIMEHSSEKATVKAITPIEEFNKHFSTEFSSDEFDTIGGLITNAFGHLPKRGETVSLGGYVFTILRADARRVHLLQVRVQTDTDETVSLDQSGNA
jgi:magnesium and cobalt transporter